MGAYEPVPFRQRIFLVSQGVFQFLLAVFVTSTVWIMAYSRDWSQVHTWHMFLCTTGFSFLMAESVALFNEGNVFLLGVGRLARGFIHGTLMFLAVVAVVTGISLKIEDKRSRGMNHFTSNHGILGLVSLVLVLITFLFGFAVTFAKFAYSKFGVKRVWVKNLHIFLGISTYIIGCVTLGFGIDSYFTDATVNTRTGLNVILGIYVCLSLLAPIKTILNL